MKALITIFLFSLFFQPLFAAETTAYCTIAPLSFVVEAVVGDKVKVKTMLPEGKAPATFRPSMRQVQDISKSNLLFVLDVFFEKNLIGKLKGSKGPKVVNVGQSISRRSMEGHHHHDSGHDHGTDFSDPHYWLSPERVEYMAKNIYRFMAKHDAPNRDFYRQNHDNFLMRVREADAAVKKILSKSRGKKVYVYHPSFGYFLDAYGLIQVPIELEGKSPTAKRLRKLVEQAKKDQVTHIFTQPQFTKRPAKIIAHKIKAKVLELDPLHKDILENWQIMAKKIGESFKQ